MTTDLDILLAQGALRGTVERAPAGAPVRAFHGVPYAAPPIGADRWRPPRPPKPWTGLRGATRPGPAPWQGAAPWPGGPDVVDEDCLTLSIWTPPSAHRQPVIVWIYGGGFEGGHAVSPVTAPHRLITENNVVFVAPNYRVGALGFAQLAHRGGPFAEASNLGLLDVVAALSWVRDNIADVGGDPGNVTVMGHSAGAFVAASLLVVPAARGIYQRLILSSGGASRIIPLTTAEHLGDRFLSELTDLVGTSTPDALAGAPGDAVTAAQARVVATDIGARNGPAPQSLGIVQDGVVVPEHPLPAVARGGAQTTPLLVGTARREVEAFVQDRAAFAPHGLSGIIDEVRSWGVPAERARAVVDAYRGAGRQPGDVRAALLTDWIYRLPAARLAAAQRSRGGDVWLYSLDDAPHLAAAVHGADIPLLFGTAEELPSGHPLTYPPRGRRRRDDTGADLRKRIASFAQHGDPGWPRTDTSGAGAMRIADAVTTDATSYHETLQIWAGVTRP